jgi:Holliday junction resolvase
MKRYTQSRRDGNHTEIVHAFQKLGASVIDTSAEGGGCPDLFVGFRGVTYPVEIKTRKGLIKPSQRRLYKQWHGSKINIVRTVGDVVKVLGL